EKLESALGIRLFDRTTRRVTLTLYGQTFAARSDQLLFNVESLLGDITKVSQERVGLVTVATVPSAAYYFMPDVIRRFQARYPQVRVRIIDSSAGNVIEAVASGEADFGLCFARSLQPNIDFLPLVGDVYVAACRRDGPIASRKSLTWREFYQQDYVGLDKSSGNRNLLDQMLEHIIPERPSICETRHVTTMLGMVEAGVGIAAVPAMSMPSSEYSLLTSVPLTDPVVRRTVGLIRRSGRMQSYLAAELEKLITEQYHAA
ncbi:MAG TPA: LysR family transcriptional regulator, partial [Erwinia persicina]|nr:LysR family transcriptional regulator [Erwinia persicina]